MKIKLILATLIIVVAVIGSNGCGKNLNQGPLSDANKISNSNQASNARQAVVVPLSSSGGLPAMIAAAAGLHNSGMSYLYNTLSSSWGTTKITSTLLAQQLENMMISTAANYVNVSLNATPPFSFNIFGSNYKYYDYTTTSMVSYIQTQSGIGLSFAVSTGLNSLQSIISGSSDASSISSQCNVLVSSILPTLSTTSDSIVFLGAVDVAINSASYWYTSSNVTLWRNYSTSIAGAPAALALTFATDPEGGGGGAGEVVKEAIFSDVLGAAVGAVRGAVVGGTAGTTIPGVGTVTGAAAGGLYGMVHGAITASVADGLKSAVRRWLNW